MKFAALVLLVLTACATAPNYYDGELVLPQTEGTFVPVTIANNRSRDVSSPPTFFLVGFGRHSLGVVSGSSQRTVLIDERWFPSDGFVTIVAHYVGGKELVYEQFSWRKGDKIEVALDEDFNWAAAWSHK